MLKFFCCRMPRIEKDCHAYVLKAEKKSQAAGNKEDFNQKKIPQQNYNQNYNKKYNNPNHNQYQNRPHNNNSYSNSKPNQKNYSNNPNPSYGQDNAGRSYPQNTHYSTEDKGNNQIIHASNGVKESNSDNLASLFKSENGSKAGSQTKPPKENRNDSSKSKEHKISQFSNAEKIKKDLSQLDSFTNSCESLNHKRPSSKELDSFEQISKKVQVEAVEQSN